jgi:hypothetical protein
VQAATVGVANSSLGKVLVDSQGRTLAAAADVQGALRYEQVIGYVRRGPATLRLGAALGEPGQETRGFGETEGFLTGTQGSVVVRDVFLPWVRANSLGRALRSASGGAGGRFSHNEWRSSR